MPIEVVDANQPSTAQENGAQEILEDFLERTKQGIIDEVIIVAIGKDHSIYCRVSDTTSLLRQLGALKIAEAGIIGTIGEE